MGEKISMIEVRLRSNVMPDSRRKSGCKKVIRSKRACGSIRAERNV